MEYRRAKTPGATYFFTVVTHQRRKILSQPENVDLLQGAFRYAMQKHPFKIDAIAILPEHIHCIWTLPPEDADFSTRWRLIKSWFSRECNIQYQGQTSASRQHKGEKAFWQRRFWEHQIQDERDFVTHIEYIHYNPVHHRLVEAPNNWQYSSFHNYVQQGIYDVMWGASEKLVFNSSIGME